MKDKDKAGASNPTLKDQTPIATKPLKLDFSNEVDLAAKLGLRCAKKSKSKMKYLNVDGSISRPIQMIT